MNVKKTDRGFQVLDHEVYPPKPGVVARVAQQSSIVGRYDDSFDRPGTSALWIGEHHHLNREEVASLVQHLQRWLDTGRLAD